MCVTQRFLWPSGDPQSDAAPLAAPRGLWLGVAHPDVCQQVHQLQSYRWWAVILRNVDSTRLDYTYTCMTLVL